jgi:hypothetical protein
MTNLFYILIWGGLLSSAVTSNVFNARHVVQTHDKGRMLVLRDGPCSYRIDDKGLSLFWKAFSFTYQVPRNFDLSDVELMTMENSGFIVEQQNSSIIIYGQHEVIESVHELCNLANFD